MSGRKMSGYWEEGKYEPLNEIDKTGRKRIVALCKFCKAILKNTSQSRLIAHRKLCFNKSPLVAVSTNIDESFSDSEGHSDSILIEEIMEEDPTGRENLIICVPDDNEKCIGFSGEGLSGAIDITTRDIDANLADDDSLIEAELEAVFVTDHNSNKYKHTNEYEASFIEPSSFLSECESLTPTSASSTPLRPFLISSGFGSSSASSSPTTSSNNRKRAFRSPEKPSRKKIVSQKKVSNFLDCTTTEQKSKLDVCLGKFFFGCNIPFHVVDSKYFKELISELRPSYKLPCRQTLSSTILNTVHTEITENDKRSIEQSQETVLLIDSWKNSSNNSKQVVTMLQTTDNKLCFLDSHDFTCISETGDDLNKICEKSIEMAKAKFGTEIYGVVSDNAKNMMAMGRKSHLWHSTCSSHTGNLLAKDIINKEIAAKVRKVLVQFKSPDMERLVIQNRGSKIKMPGETRWCSYRDSFSCFVNNLSVFKKIAAEQTNHKLKTEIIQLIYDEELLERVKYIIEISDPVCTLINKSQSMSYSIADAAEDWLTLKLPEEYEEQLRKRKLMALNQYALTANYLHPLYRGSNMDENQLDIVDQFLLDILETNGLDSLQQFKLNEGIFETLRAKGVTKSRTFWNLTERRHKELASVANKLMKIPASSAQLERLFSNWGHIHSLRRNRLLSTTSQKLLHTYYSLKLNDLHQISDSEFSEED